MKMAKLPSSPPSYKRKCRLRVRVIVALVMASLLLELLMVNFVWIISGAAGNSIGGFLVPEGGAPADDAAASRRRGLQDPEQQQDGNDAGDDLVVNTSGEETSTRDTDSEEAPVIMDDGPPLDNYYQRKHIPNNVSVPLLVGGSDGSGTRAVVDLLGKLGAVMIVEDRQTLDVHAWDMFKGKGWPPMVQMVLQNTHSSNYEFRDLPQHVQDTIRTQLAKLDKHHNDSFKFLESRERQAPSRVVPVADGVTYGIKAPISLTLVPTFLETWKKMRFIHVVRDGRDVALSANQSPVKKFYEMSYSDGAERLKKYVDDMVPLRAMHLWNDWNANLLEWEKAHADGETFDYFVLRTEDLLNPTTKFKSLVRLADFVGSKLTLEQLCCLSREKMRDMGVSSRGGGRRRRGRLAGRNDGRRRLLLQLKQRYGKWKTMLSDKPQLSEAMHRDGADGLNAFGYEPAANFMDLNKDDNGEWSRFVCDEDTIECPPPGALRPNLGFRRARGRTSSRLTKRREELQELFAGRHVSRESQRRHRIHLTLEERRHNLGARIGNGRHGF